MDVTSHNLQVLGVANISSMVQVSLRYKKILNVLILSRSKYMTSIESRSRYGSKSTMDPTFLQPQFLPIYK